MNETENNFEALRRLLALKRQETPPPGFFENFSGQVTARIRAGEDGAAEREGIELPWLFRLLSVFEAKPAFAGSFASALCLLLVLGVFYGETPDATPQPLLSAANTSSPLAMAPAISYNPQPVEQPAIIPVTSTNPVFSAQPATAWFGSQAATVQQIPYMLGN